MRKHILPVLLLFFYLNTLYGFDNDSLMSSLSFRTEIEKENFQLFLEDSTQFFPIFQAIGFEGTKGDIRSKENHLEASISRFKTEKFTSYKTSKKAKVIFKEIHDEYFEKYELGSSFNKIFSDGLFNCASATAAYGIVFEELGYEYQIKVLPNHVYLILFPEEEAIKIETTNPLKGYQVTDEKAKREYVRFLKDTKLISEKEYDSKSIEEIFEEYYYNHNTIGLKQMAGVLYFNYGITLFEESKWAEAFNEFEKAELFFKNERVDFMLMASLNNYMYGIEYVKYDDLRYVVKVADNASIEAARQNVIIYFNNYLKRYLLDKGDVDQAEKGFKYIEKHLHDTALRAEIDFTYYFEMGRHAAAKGNYKTSNEYFGKTLLIKPNNIDAQNAFVETLITRMNNIEVDSSIHLIQTYWVEYDFLHSNAQFNQLMTSAYLFGALNALNAGQITEGKSFISSFEQHCNENDNYLINHELVSEVYTSIAVYYFGKGHYTSAKKYINKGLEYSPNDYELRRALNSF